MKKHQPNDKEHGPDKHFWRFISEIFQAVGISYFTPQEKDFYIDEDKRRRE